MSIKALQDYTYYSRYARYNKEAKRRETWGEATNRVKQMHLKKYPQIAQDIEWAFDLVEQKRVLGSQRALQFGGTPIEKKNARIYNCTVSFCDRMRFFQECFWLLLCGCGTGFSVQKHHIAKLPEFLPRPINNLEKYYIPDTIEGWADALGILLATYFPSEEFPEWSGKTVEFDYSFIRTAGSPLASGVGKAPGPEPLRRALDTIRTHLNQCITKGLAKLRPIDAYDVVMHASDAVLSGGVRRSATICIFSFDDEEMIKAKTGNWFVDNPQRGRSNNSALLLRDSVTRDQFLSLMASVKEFGEPGFYFSDSTEQLPNPCVEIGMWPVEEETLKSGWSFCNLCEINGGKIKSKEDFALAAKAASIIGTCQAGYASFEYLGSVTENIVKREALLGVSLTGMMDNPDVIFNAEIQKEMAELILRVNEDIAAKIGINPTARATCVKPAGSTSCILGTSSGIHPHHARRYLRRVQGNSLEPVLQYFKEFNPTAVETSVWSANKTDEVITFCCEVPDGAKTKNDTSAIDLLDHVKLTQQNWVAAGKVEARCTQPWLTHNVSNTINVQEDEWDQVADYIYNNRKWFAGISLLPASGDLDYPQAPFCNVLTPREILQKYGDGALLASGLIVDGLHAFNNNLWKACDAVLGFGDPIVMPITPGNVVLSDAIMNSLDNCSQQSELTDVVYYAYKAVEDSVSVEELQEWSNNLVDCLSKKAWIRRVKQFAERYCENDIKKCLHLLKHVNNWKMWLDLKREYKDIDYTNLIEELDVTEVTKEWACSGQGCVLT